VAGTVSALDNQCVFPAPPSGRPDSGILDFNAKGISLATDAGVLSADENVFLAGTNAANALGLSDQVPAKVVFLTDGPTRTVQIGSTTIQLRRTTARNMAAAGRLSGLLIQAFRELGKEHVTLEQRKHLKRTLPLDQRRELLKDLRLAPAWMHPIFRELAEDDA
jgi:hypothetical protein